MKKFFCVFLFFLISLPCLAATITVTSPTSTNQWTIGNTYEIRWTHSGFTNPSGLTVNIRLRRGTTVVCNIASGVPLTAGRYSWTINTSSCPGVSPGRYVIRVRVPDAEFGDSPEFEVVAGRAHPVVKAIPYKGITLPFIPEESGTMILRMSEGRELCSGDYTIKVGDEGPTRSTYYGCIRAFLSFDLTRLASLLPAGATVKEIRLMLKRMTGTSSGAAGNPFGELGHFQVVQISYVRARPACEDFNRPGTFLFDAPCPCSEVDMTGIDVTSAVNALRSSGRTRFQVRLQFSVRNNNDGEYDYAVFLGGDAGTHLAIKYTE